MAGELLTAQGRRIAYDQLAPVGVPGVVPGVVFLGGFRSDRTGTKALALEDWARGRGLGFLRFDYSGHGQSSGAFADGCIGDWAADAIAAIASLTTGPQVLVGSSMGGWIGLLACRALAPRIAGLVTIAAAPDFTEDLMWARFSQAERAQMAATGRVVQASQYGQDPDILTARLIEEGRRHLVLRSPLHLPFPVRMLQGSADAEVPPEVAHRLFAHATGPDIRLTLVKGADHRFSTPACLRLIETTTEAVLVRAAGSGGGGED